MTGELVVSRSGEVHRLTLNRPGKGNSLSADLVEALHDSLDAVEQAKGRVLILQGEGRNFCTGFDLGDLDGASDGDLLWRFVRIEQLLARLWQAPFATIAVGKGRVFGAGADLLVACGRRIVVEQATFSFPGAGFGLVLGTRRLAHRIGETAAQHVVASGAAIAAEEAVRLNLATACVAEPDLQATLDREVAVATRLDRETYAAIGEASGSDAGALDRDLAMLVRSAARPGLRQRIEAYRARR
ncbi:Enoyl-CoA hydratase/isomerase [Rhizorhabdus wittichii RW1]|uniref:Enoyl-CoA hydratase/isomerase n=1 Tax=Rhizorhabdus wittichii (strain DSM 6014 / CCUG 31198 / JCM 15750 / NBRC 105917 / EY 4224 / RW1) TaxID=392499 RepID=A0A9J9LDF4_RHIWR|nr:Enoyl-CoA hydratase/isomerase [Rhizorhabdus wittichii RW1]